MKKAKKPQYKPPSSLIDNFKASRADTRSRSTSSMTLLAKPISRSNLFGINFRFRTRKNFSLILLAGLSALLCALYYTSYYPGTVWTLRFGVTSFTARNANGSSNNPNQQQPELVDDSTNNLIQARLPGGGGGDGDGDDGPSALGLNGRKFPSALDERRRTAGRRNHNGNIDNGLVISGRKDGGNNHQNKKRGGESGETAEEINSTPKDWKYWASLGYWKVNLTGNDDEDGDGGSREPLEKVEGGQGLNSAQRLPHSSATVSFSTGESLGSASASLSSSSGATRALPPTNAKKVKGLACKFPRLDPFDPSITDFIKAPQDIDCAMEFPLVFRTNFRNKLIQLGHPFPGLPEAATASASSSPSPATGEGPGGNGERRERLRSNSNYTCCYKTISRGNGSDHDITYSKRCFPILKPETEIPTSHEFISVRCRYIGGNGTKDQRRPPERNRESSSNSNGGAGEDNSSSNNHNNMGNNSSSNIGGGNSNNTTRVYRDMMAFVPLKPWVEDRIRKYEESKRKSLYEQKRAAYGGIKTNIKDNGGEGRMNTQQKQDQGINKLGGGSNAFHQQHHHNNHEQIQQQSHIMRDGTNRKDQDQQTSQLERDGPPPPPPIVNEEQDQLSVVILGLDAQSHMNFIRQMPQSYNFLTKNLSAIGMYGYTKVGDNTFPNVVAALAGLTERELEKACWHKRKSYFDSCPFIWRKFAESGYRTSLAEDAVWMGSFNYGKKGFFQSPTDYYLHPMTLLMSGKIGHEGRGNANLCYGPRLAFEVLLDYIVKTAVTFRNSLYFQFVWSNSLFHDYLNNARLGDELLFMTLQFLRNNGFLNNTAFILASDHGIRWGEILTTTQGKIEERMPFIYFAFPSWFRHKYPHAMRNLRKNAMRLTTPFDVHETLQDILHLSQGKHIRFDRWNDYESNNINDSASSRGYRKSSGKGGAGFGESDEKPPRGISLFRPVPLKRTCKLAGIDEQWCVCHSMQSVPINSSLVQSGAQFIVQVINGLLRKHREAGFCAKLSLFKINEAKRIIDGDIDRGLDIHFSLPDAPAGKGGTGMNASVHVSTNATFSSQHHLTSYSAGHVANNLSDVNRTETKNDSVINVGTNLRIHKYHKTDNGTGGSESLLDKMEKESTTGKSGAVINASSTAEASGSPSGRILMTTSQGETTVMSSLSTSSDIKRMIQLQITLVTRPGDAVFEATIYGEAVIGNDLVNDQDINQEAGERSHHHWKLAGDMSRLNMYGSQSSCITDLAALKYCYCHKQA